MKMFLTRLGFNSKMVVTGDITQIDLPDGRKSGLREVLRVLRGVEDIAICSFNEKDVVRHQLVQRIIQAYERDVYKRQVLIYALLLQFLSGRIWIVNIEGNDQVPEASIREVLEPLGVQEGGDFRKLDEMCIRDRSRI